MLQHILSIVQDVIQTGAATAVIAAVSVYLTQQYRRWKWRSKNLYPELKSVQLELSSIEPIQIGEYLLLEQMHEKRDNERMCDLFIRVYTRLADSFDAAAVIFKRCEHLLPPRDRKSLSMIYESYQLASINVFREMSAPSERKDLDKEKLALEVQYRSMVNFVLRLKGSVTRQLDYLTP
jgi:hypothetical protein